MVDDKIKELGEALNERERRFADNILAGVKIGKAYRDAGYLAEGNSSQVNGCRLLRDAQVQAYIEAQRDHALENVGVTKEMILREYARLGFSDILSVASFNGEVALRDSEELTEDEARAICKIKDTQHGVEVEFHRKQPALDALAREAGICIERREVTGKGGGPIQTALDFSGLDDDELAELRRLALKGGSDPGA